jgi:hypothetical protein
MSQNTRETAIETTAALTQQTLSNFIQIMLERYRFAELLARRKRTQSVTQSPPELCVTTNSQWMMKCRVKGLIAGTFIYRPASRDIKGMWRYINCKCPFAVNHRVVWESSFVNDCDCRAATMGRQKGFPQIPMGNSCANKGKLDNN